MQAGVFEQKVGGLDAYNERQMFSHRNSPMDCVPPKDVTKNLDVFVPTLYRWVPASAHA